MRHSELLCLKCAKTIDFIYLTFQTYALLYVRVA